MLRWSSPIVRFFGRRLFAHSPANWHMLRSTCDKRDLSVRGAPSLDRRARGRSGLPRIEFGRTLLLND